MSKLMIKTKVCHIITGMNIGGAETMLFNIQKYQRNPNVEHLVISLNDKGGMINKYNDEGFEYYLFNIKKHPLKSVIEIKNIVKKCDVLSCWMYHSNFVGYIVNKFTKCKKLIWNIRHTDIDKNLNSKSMRLCNWFCKKWSKNVDIIAYNGEKAKQIHEEYGYDATKSVVMINGCDTNLFNPVNRDTNKLHKDLNINENTKIVLSVARYSKMKDFPAFINIINHVKKEFDIVGVMCGNGAESSNQELLELIQNQGLEINKDIFLLGERKDIPYIMASSDIYVMHSCGGEAFPNTIIQAMASGRPVVSTDAGIARTIIRDDRFVSEVKNYVELSENLSKMLNISYEELEEIGNKNRKRVINNYNINQIVSNYEEMYLL